MIWDTKTINKKKYIQATDKKWDLIWIEYMNKTCF